MSQTIFHYMLVKQYLNPYTFAIKIDGITNATNRAFKSFFLIFHISKLNNDSFLFEKAGKMKSSF